MKASLAEVVGNLLSIGFQIATVVEPAGVRVTIAGDHVTIAGTGEDFASALKNALRLDNPASVLRR
jgi:ribosomal protein L6P/L9E